MTRILFPSGPERTLAFYLSAEEYVAAMDLDDEAVFFWRVGPSVIFGRNQCMEAEVNVPWCREHGVRIYRRKSGGGCVYADKGNIMISCVSPGVDVEFAFNRYLFRIAGVLALLGINAEVSGRNDILSSGRKISGNACYISRNKSIVHGTVLYDVNIDAMLAAITPSSEKLSRHGVASVRQRVANIRPLLGKDSAVYDPESLVSFISAHLCDGSQMLTEEDAAKIETESAKYLDEVFIAGRDRKEMSLNR